MASSHGTVSHLLPQSYKRMVAAWLEEDVPSYDYGGFVVGEAPGEARLLGKSVGMIAGLPFFDEVFRQLDCTSVNSGPVIAPLHSVPATSSNLLKLLRDAGYKNILAGTRKTTPGFRLVEKYGLLVGGCDPHRIDLSTMTMLKDNHIWSSGSITAAVKAAQASGGFAIKVEVECQSEAEADEAIEAGADIVMLDNFTAEGMKAAAANLKQKWGKGPGGRGPLIEVSGGLTEDNIGPYARTEAKLSRFNARREAHKPSQDFLHESFPPPILRPSPTIMIIRQLALRQGRKALSAPAGRTWFRSLTTETEAIESSLNNSLKETKSIDAYLNNSQSSKQQHQTKPLDSDHGPETSEAQQQESVASIYHTFRHQQSTTAHLGTSVGPHYQPHTLLTQPPSPSEITLELLLASQAHLGHATSLWNPANSRYIFGIREGIHIISLDVTAAHLRRAAKVISGVTERGGLILFVGTRDGQDRCIVNAAKLAGGCHLFERWIPGSITNGQQILGGCRVKVVDEFDRELDGYADQLVDRAALKPDLVVCVNPLENYVLLHECGLNGIPTVGIIDTDADPTWVTYPIPANDDSLRCVQVIAGVLGKAGEEGQKKRRRAAERGETTFTPTPGLVRSSVSNDTAVEAAT
ncbi:MAG: 37S ribosomal protein, mitochondrial [Pycnora praestabilis]|nr:MAG: 37S ribosomal protein, mitochondrial [Pycnora praestabilis]